MRRLEYGKCRRGLVELKSMAIKETHFSDWEILLGECNKKRKNFTSLLEHRPIKSGLPEILAIKLSTNKTIRNFME